jgi:hypothetical protein
MPSQRSILMYDQIEPVEIIVVPFTTEQTPIRLWQGKEI